MGLVLAAVLRTAVAQEAPDPLPAVSSAAAPDRSHKIRAANDPALAAELRGRGGVLIADYGGYQLYESPWPEQGLAAHPAAEARDDYNLILLNAIRLDTTQAPVKALRKAAGNFAGKRLHLVQFAGPVRPEWHRALAATGARIVAYLPQNAYLTYGDAGSIGRLQSLAAGAPHIQWEGACQDDYKIHPAARVVDALGRPRAIGTDAFSVQLVEDAEANAATLKLLDQLKREPFKSPTRFLGYVNLVVRLAPGDVARVAARPEVVSILPWFAPQKFDERQDQIVAGNVSGGLPDGPGYLGWLASRGFTQAQFDASGFVVDVTDSGIDDGTTTPNHFALYTGGIVTNASRVVYARLEGFPNFPSTRAGCDGHGTLNAHIIGGFDGQPDGFPHTDGDGFHYGLGVCPFVKLGSSVIFDPSNFTSPSYPDLQSSAFQDGARVSNNSWGSSVRSAYDVASQTYDALVRDAQPDGALVPAPGNQEMVMVFAAGNQGPTARTITSPATAKNIISVGAAENVQAFGGSDGSRVGDSLADNAEDIPGFSSRGPCSDGRHKPDLLAPGTHVSGGVIQAPGPGPDGTADPCFDGSGVSGGVGSSFFPNDQQFFTASSGTSLAAPAVAGGCALVRQYFINQFSNAPSAAMTKAWLMNSARYLTGTNGNDTLWSDTQGMGELNLGQAFDGVPRILRDENPADLFTSSGQTRTFFGFISDTNQPVRITVAWTDAPGSTIGSAFNNDLDLTVTVGTNLYKGNVFNGAYSATGGTADSADNVESVFLPAGVSGSVRVQITAASINSDGVPNNSIPLDQDFALVIYNALPLPDAGAAGIALIAEDCFPTNGVIDPGETVTVNFAFQNVGLANATNLVATLLSGGGVVSPGGPQTYGALAVGGAAVSRPFRFTAAGNCGDAITATFHIQEGPADLGTVVVPLRLGVPVIPMPLVEAFDGVAPPALPAGWTTAATGAQSAWITSTTNADTPPNAAFSPDASDVGVNELVTPPIAIASASAWLSFRQNYDLEASTTSFSTAYDGGVLEIKIGNGAFTDILAAGGSFTSNGYTRTISTLYQNPLGGRQAWSGNSGGFLTTIVNLPASAAGQNIQLKWRCGSDNSTSKHGWYVDTVAITDATYYVCCQSLVDLAVTQAAAPGYLDAGQHLSYTLSISNLGPALASSVTLTDALSAGVTFVSGSPGVVAIGGEILGAFGVLPAGGSTNITITVIPTLGGFLTNTVAATAPGTSDTNSANNTAVTVTLVNAPAVIRGINPGPGGVSLNVSTATGLTYSLEYKDSLDDPAWLPISPTLAGTGGVITLTDPNPPGTHRFYRVHSQ